MAQHKLSIPEYEWTKQMNEQFWHQLRADNVGGSEVSDLFNKGFNSYYQLWHIKNGTLDPIDLSDNERVMAGNHLEGAIMAWANQKWCMDFADPKAYYKHPEVRGMACTPDGISQSNPKIICQIKNVDSIIYGRDWEGDGDDITNAPLKYLLQTQHEMCCAGAEECHLIAMIGGNSLKRMIIFPDDDVQSLIKKSIKMFWDSIDANDQPEPDFSLDGPALAVIRQSLPISEEPVNMTNNNRLVELVNLQRDAAEKEKAAAAAKSAASTEIVHICSGIKKISCGDFNISIVDIAANEGTVVTEEMVGTKINARKASSYPRITKPKKKD